MRLKDDSGMRFAYAFDEGETFCAFTQFGTGEYFVATNRRVYSLLPGGKLVALKIEWPPATSSSD